MFQNSLKFEPVGVGHSRHVIFCLTMCNRKQDLVLFFSRVVIPHFMRRQLLCEKITISGGQVCTFGGLMLVLWLDLKKCPKIVFPFQNENPKSGIKLNIQGQNFRDTSVRLRQQ